MFFSYNLLLLPILLQYDIRLNIGLLSLTNSFLFSANSPRLSITNTRAIVTIRDNDNPFGVISFTAQSISPTTQESVGQLMLRLQRTGGVFSRVTVLIRSIGGGEPWQDSVINGLPSSSPIRTALSARTKVASAVNPNQDYLPLNKEVVFEV